MRYPSALAAFSSVPSFVTLFSVTPKRRNSRSATSCPISTERRCSACRMNWRMRACARLVFTNVSQSFDGCEWGEVRISTVSPFFSLYRSGTSFPFTFAPTVCSPICEWMVYAKSTGVAPRGRLFTAPFGVKTKTSSEKRSTLTVSRNSRGSSSSFWNSTSWRSHPNDSASRFESASPPFPSRPFSLYAQCAATPSSAMRCISAVRICTSMRSPAGPTTVVCSDWYRFGFGIAM